MDGCAVFSRRDVPTHVVAGTDLEDIRLSEVGQPQQDRAVQFRLHEAAREVQISRQKRPFSPFSAEAGEEQGASVSWPHSFCLRRGESGRVWWDIRNSQETETGGDL